jgi:predicted transcriptional regulator YdeE
MARRKKKSNVYFTKITDIAISAYNKSDSTVKREKIYRRFIYPAFMKLAENLINKIKPTYIDSSFLDLQTDLVTFLTERLNKFNPNNGKAYSYYTRTSFNYLIGENDRAYKKLKSDAMELDVDEQRNVLTEMHNNEMRETLEYFMDAYVDYCYDNLNYIFTNSSDIHVADSILHIFENREYVEDFNKKRLYILIRERTGLDPSQTTLVTRVVKVLKQIYEENFKEYERTNFVKLPF